jgi:periplasmic protein TonB
MKFIALHSRGGNYLVVASNVAWLRTAENGQTLVGIVGGQPLLVAGSIDEIAALLSGDELQEGQGSISAHPQI